ncbi:MAG: GTP-binding protein [Eggerthellaceae bacterium]|nr:GTP-binding protein [Eggerthellaceae bacterium]
MSGKPNVIILSGFLGSGKTTVLMQLIGRMRERLGDECRIAIIENEIGSASVDSSIIEDAGYSVTEMLSGCVCCTLIGQLVPALNKLADEMNPQLVILEATGMATPDSMRENIERYGGYPTRIVTLVDASRWERIRRALQILLEAQVEPADIICLNKTDLASEDELAAIEESVREINATAPIARISAASPVSVDVLDEVLGA